MQQVKKKKVLLKDLNRTLIQPKVAISYLQVSVCYGTIVCRSVLYPDLK